MRCFARREQTRGITSDGAETCLLIMFEHEVSYAAIG